MSKQVQLHAVNHAMQQLVRCASKLLPYNPAGPADMEAPDRVPFDVAHVKQACPAALQAVAPHNLAWLKF